MTSIKHTATALRTSMLAMLLCCSMLVGTTFAWFTDSVTSGKNKIVAGNLDVGDKNFVADAEGNPTEKSLSDVIKVAVLDHHFDGDRAAAQALTFSESLASFTKTGALMTEDKGENATVVDIEKGVIPGAGEGHTAKLKVLVSASEPDPGAAGTVQQVAVIDITLLVDGGQVHLFTDGKYATITTYLEPGLSSVQVLYNGEALDTELVTYDEVTGELTIKNSTKKGITVAGGAELKFTDKTGKGELILDTVKSSNHAIYASGTSSKTTKVTFENITIKVQNEVSSTTSSSNASVTVAILAGTYSTVTLGEGTVIEANDEKVAYCNGYVIAASGRKSAVNIDGAEINADGTVTPVVAYNSGTVNMNGGTINVTGDLTGGTSTSYPQYRSVCIAIGGTGNSDDRTINVTGGTINLTPTAGMAFGVETSMLANTTRAYFGGNAVINVDAGPGAEAYGFAAGQGCPIGLYHDGPTYNVVENYEGNSLIYSDNSNYTSLAVQWMDR